MATPPSPVGAGFKMRTGSLLIAALTVVAGGAVQQPRAHAVEAAHHSRTAARNG